MEQTKRGFGAWGWFLLIFGFLIFFSNGGFFADGTNVIAPAVAERLGVDRTIILNMNTVAGIVGVIIAIIAGQLNQRIGPAKVAAGCLILAGLGHIATGNAVSVPMYLIAMCCVGGGLSAGSFVGIGTLVAMWFPRKQGQAMSVVAMGSNFGTMVFVPLLTVLVGSLGIAVSSVICGVVAAVVGVIGAVMLRNTPQERGLYPDNVTEAEFKANYAAAAPEEDPHGWTVGKLLCTKETWLCVLSTGFLMLVQMGIMTQLVARNMEVGMNQALATGVMSAIAVIGVIGSVIIGRIVFKLGIKKAGVMTAVLYVVALLCNISGIMPLVWISLVIIGFLGAAAPHLMNSIPGSVFGRVGYAKVNSVVFPITNIIFMCNFAVNGIVQGLFHSISAVYIVFAVLALISLFLILAIQDHKYDQDYMAAHKN
ncbi:MFS transporter [Flavonifractor sp. An10]|uniref:MFS transporter n=1 Tax=Flavonifractor sp. An10 TaxID=1965537 RepID=UPI000B39590D|nr:MFS transporter [Flavonifractor sp. An10]OUQ84080.1 MFS transporter [Flavonifractor sp. An10]